MARHLRDTLGSMLLDHPLEGASTSLPSPEVNSGMGCPEKRAGGLARRPAWS